MEALVFVLGRVSRSAVRKLDGGEPKRSRVSFREVLRKRMNNQRWSRALLVSVLALWACAGCQPGYMKASDLESRGQGPSACIKSCEDIGMRMGALVLVGNDLPGCVCQPLTLQGAAPPKAEPAPPAQAPAAAPPAPAPAPAAPAAPGGAAFDSTTQSSNDAAAATTTGYVVLAAAAAARQARLERQ